MPLSEICFMTAVEMARRLAVGEFSAVEVLEAHLAQIERVNPTVNAIVTHTPERALERARHADSAHRAGRSLGPLHGLPIAHKDLQPTAGIRTTKGSVIYRNWVPDFDSLTVQRLRAAGAICLGKTNVPEFGVGSHTFNPVFGPTRNPYDTTRSCGGSSGGAAVALACGMIPIADGSDMGGSLRNPASFCNVVGMRPSAGRVPDLPTENHWYGVPVDGPMGRCVADVALLLSAMAGPDPRSSAALEAPGALFARPLERDFTGVRVAWCRDVFGLPLEPGVREAFAHSRAVFELLGCIVDDAEPDLSGVEEAFMAWRHVRTCLMVAQHVAEYGPGVRDLFKPEILWHAEQGARMAAADLVRAENLRSQLFDRMAAFMERYEFMALPTVQVLPFDVEQRWVAEVDGAPMPTYMSWMSSCWYISAPGNPAISVPADFVGEAPGQGGEGSREDMNALPFGIQIVGRHRDDWGVLQMAHAFEQAAGSLWRRHPAIAM
jgi:amidase